ncbi:MAG TPA: alpha/beta fold hydrolase [Streptosporangiaceae bacterium]
MTAPPRPEAARPGPEAARYAGRAHVRHDGPYPYPGREPGAAGGPAPVLLLHGLGGDSGQLWAYLDGTGGPGRVAPDLRAHGATSYIGPEAAYTFDGLADDVIALLDRLGLTAPVVTAGVSMGAGIALNLALRWPGRVSALVLVRPAWLDRPLPPNLAAYPLIAQLLRTHGAAGGLTRFGHSGVHQAVLAESPSAAASLRGQFTAPGAAGRAVRLDRMPRSAPSPEVTTLRQVRQPALVVGAPRDPVHPLALAQATAAALPEASLRVVKARDEDPPGQLAQIARETARFVQQVR